MTDGDAEMTDASERTTWVLVDGENIDATLGQSILGRRPNPEERPRWDRLLTFCTATWHQPARGVFFLNASAGIPMAFAQALKTMGFVVVPLAGAPDEKVVDIAIQRTLQRLVSFAGDVMLVSHDGDFIDDLRPLTTDGRRLGVIGFPEFRNSGFNSLDGLEKFDLELDVHAFDTPLARLRVIPIAEFDPASFLR